MSSDSLLETSVASPKANIDLGVHDPSMHPSDGDLWYNDLLSERASVHKDHNIQDIPSTPVKEPSSVRDFPFKQLQHVVDKLVGTSQNRVVITSVLPCA